MKKEINSYIKKHNQYIDYRLQLINNYVSLNNNNKSIVELIISYLISQCNKILKYFDEENETYLNELKTLLLQWDILKDGDLIGYIYQSLERTFNKKKKGQYFTPPDIVSFIVDKAIARHTNYSQLKILDPACGSGQFLIEAYRQLINNNSNSNTTGTETAKEIIKNQIHGIDLDPIAVKIARYNLSKIAGCTTDEVQIYNADFLYKDDLKITGDPSFGNKFDIVIGNPPWCSKIPKEKKKYYTKNYQSIKSGINTFTLFIERSFEFITDNGTVAYLIPEAYLNIKAHRSSRIFTLQNAEIQNIAIWGERFKGVYAPSISIIMKNNPIANLKRNNIISIIHDTRNNINQAILIPQAYYDKTHENIFNTNYSRKAVNVISAIENQDCFFLKGRSRFFLGIVTGNNAQYISNSKSIKYPDPIIIGKDIGQYKINFSNHYFKYNQRILQQVAPENLYKSGKKIIYKFIGKRLTFALDKSGFYTLNNVNCFIPDFNSINIETALSILNSKVIQYYYQKNFFTIKVLRGNLECLPLKFISKSNQVKLKKLANMLINSSESTISRYRENIEDIIFHEYGIKDREAYLIDEG